MITNKTKITIKWINTKVRYKSKIEEIQREKIIIYTKLNNYFTKLTLQNYTAKEKETKIFNYFKHIFSVLLYVTSEKDSLSRSCVYSFLYNKETVFDKFLTNI